MKVQDTPTIEVPPLIQKCIGFFVGGWGMLFLWIGIWAFFTLVPGILSATFEQFFRGLFFVGILFGIGTTLTVLAWKIYQDAKSNEN